MPKKIQIDINQLILDKAKMVESAQKRVVPIPIGQDTLNFKNDPAIMNQLEKNGKYPLLSELNFRAHRLQHQSPEV